MVISFYVACGCGDAIDTFGKIMRRVIGTLPSALNAICSQFEPALSYPSLATISRARFYLDCAFMAHMRSVHARLVGRNGVVFGQWDSSPEGGRNWFMHEYDAIQEDDLENMKDVAMMLRELRESVEGMVNDGELCDFAKRHENLVMFIKERIKHHVFPPTQVGSRTAGLAEKCHCALHQMRLETMSFSEVQQLIGIYFSNTGDRGTEKAVNTMNILVDEFFPYWHREGAGQEDFADLEVEQAIEPAIFSFNNMLQFPGSFHVRDLIGRRLLRRLPSWRRIKPLLSSSCRTFHYLYSREYFIERCLQEQYRPFRV